MSETHPPQKRRPFQFSLAWLLIFMTVVAVVLGLSASIAGAVVHSLFSLVVLAVYPAVLVACIVYGRGDFQAFALGAFVPGTPWTVMSPWSVRITADPILALRDFERTRYWTGTVVLPAAK